MQSEKDTEGPDADGGESCPLCKRVTQHQFCDAHHLGSFDMTGDGEYGIGLCGGTLYGMGEIGEVFNAARRDYAKARIGGKSRAVAVPAWCKDIPGLKEYVESVGESDYDPDPSDYADVPTDTEVQEFADALTDAGSTDLMLTALLSWLEGMGIQVVETTWENDVPMVSSSSIEWWCESPEDAAAKLTNRLRQILDRRAKS